MAPHNKIQGSYRAISTVGKEILGQMNFQAEDFVHRPALAPHLSDRLKGKSNRKAWIDAHMKSWAERILRQYVKALPAGIF